ncbi:MAG: peptidase C39 family protein [Oscillospiraceae bacterium]|nr:peptidase C39 family protein [Oscillospiraceae bacterium]
MSEIKFFGQHAFEEYGITGTETCGISCALMVLDYFDKMHPSKGKELELYRKYKIKGNRGTLGGAVGRILHEKGIDVKIVHSSEKLLDNLGGYYSEEMYEDFLSQHKKHIEAGGFISKKGCDITLKTIEEELYSGNLVILQCFINGNADGIHDKVMHWVLLYKFDDEKFFICDPMFGKTTITKAEAEDYMKTPFGKIYISAKKR